ncbi:F-box/kelch-repeat protein At1g74510-like [Mangifera indica]|uniref:F-box/kelch-repeat protein At1g74510-like n=1 Tax=Mangifera indica TaxID=29780 RepID=UPI001CF936FC|nr:F-box/kelch-repeat protein At1g74510-like [Mangifera indica]
MFEISEELAKQEGKPISEELQKQEGDHISNELTNQDGEQISKELSNQDGEQVSNELTNQDGEQISKELSNQDGEQISNELTNQDGVWTYNIFDVIDNCKRPLEDGEDPAARNVAKPLEFHEKEDTVKGMHDLSLTQIDHPDKSNHVGYHSESSSLISKLGRDLSINCLAHCSRSDYGAIAAVNKTFWSLIRSGELYRMRRCMGVIEHWVYFSCNPMEWEAFDPFRHRWMRLPRMPPTEIFMFSDKESLGVGTDLLVFGKEITSPIVFKYSLLANTWSLGISMNAPRCLFGSASSGEIAIVAGGCDPTGRILSSAELYNSTTSMWVSIPNMHMPRKMCSGAFIDGKFYVVSGIGIENPGMLTSGEVYDFEKNTWTVIPDMFPPRNGEVGGTTFVAGGAPPLIAVVKNELYAADYARHEVSRYDKTGNVWITLGRLPEGADSMNGWGLAFRGCGDMLVVIGGRRNSGGGVIELYAWVPSEGPLEWNLLAAKVSPNFVYNCAVMGC